LVLRVIALADAQKNGDVVRANSLPNSTPKHRVDQLVNRLTKILAEARKLKPDA